MIRALIAFVAAACGFVAATADAAPVRNPDSGLPAFVFDTPDGWSVSRAGPETVLIEPPDTGASVALVMVTVEPTSASDVEYGEALIKAMGAAAPTAHASSDIDGHAGAVWDTTAAASPTLVLRARFRVVKLDSTHFAASEELRPPGMTPQQEAAFRQLLQSVRLITSPAAPSDTGDSEESPAGAEASPFEMGHVYVCNGERVAVAHCGSAEQGDYCEVDYLDRQHNGFMVQTSEHRKDIAERLRSCALK